MRNMIRGSRVKDLAKKKGWSLEKLRQEAQPFRPGLAWSTLSKVVNEKQEPTVDVVQALAQALETNTDYLMGLSDDWRKRVDSTPLPEPDIADLVIALNHQPATVRAVLAQIVDAVLKLIGAVPNVSDGDPARVRQLLAGMTRSEVAALLAEMDDLERDEGARERSAGA